MLQILRLVEQNQLLSGKVMQLYWTIPPGHRAVYAVQYILGALTDKVYNHVAMIARVGVADWRLCQFICIWTELGSLLNSLTRPLDLTLAQSPL